MVWSGCLFVCLLWLLNAAVECGCLIRLFAASAGAGWQWVQGGYEFVFDAGFFQFVFVASAFWALVWGDDDASSASGGVAVSALGALLNELGGGGWCNHGGVFSFDWVFFFGWVLCYGLV